MARGHKGLPRAIKKTISRQQLLSQLRQVDNDQDRRARVLRLENAFRTKIETHISALPKKDAIFQKFNTSPYVLLVHARQRGYSKVSELEADILPAKQFSSMETSAGRMVEEVVLPEYGWECVASEMHSSNSALDGKRLDDGIYHLATLKSGPRCLNDEMSENFADAVLGNYQSWSRESGADTIDFSYGVLYGTEKLSNKKDWHILRNIKKKCGDSLTISPDKQWTCQFVENGITVDVTVRIGLDWWNHLGGSLCFIEVFAALVRACINVGAADAKNYEYTIEDLNAIVSVDSVRETYNVSLLQRSQLPWLFLMARHFCDELEE
jgi:hypothetical protein